MSLTLQKNNRIPSLLAAFPRAVTQTTKEIRQNIAEDARSRAPVDSSELRESIVATEEGVEATAPHALWVEIGTEKMSPRPFLTPAIQAAEDALISSIRDSLK